MNCKENMRDIKEIPGELLKNGRLIENRYAVLEMIPKGGIIGEVGVAYGDFSKHLIEVINPSHFYAIDYFQGGGNTDFWDRTDFKESGLSHEDFYKRRFAEMIPDSMTVCSGYSWDCLNELEDDLFDYLYIDAAHDYESVKKDIDAAIPKVKDQGIIQFNDYTIWVPDDELYYGVVPAVNEFICNTRSQVLYYCFQKNGYADIVVRLNKGN